MGKENNINLLIAQILTTKKLMIALEHVFVVQFPVKKLSKTSRKEMKPQ